jgi:Lrp/AsnC family leucine-responsive transcriptional regulator
VVVKNVKEFEKIFFEFNSLFGRYILKQVAVAHGKVDVISRSYLPEKPGTCIEWFEKYEPLVFDAEEKKILHLLGSNSRMRIKDMSKKIGINPKTLVSKIKRLEQNGTIARYRLQLDVSKLGLQFYKVIVHLKDYSEKKDRELTEYCRELGNIFHYERKIGSWPLELEMDVESYEETEKIMYSMKERFSEFIERYELLLIKEETKGELDLTRFL